MSRNPKFIEFFKMPVLLSSFSGLYVPGAQKLLPMSKFFDKLFKILAVLCLSVIFVIIVDVPITVSQKRYPEVMGYFFLAGVYMVLCDFLRVFYMVVRRKEWSNIINQWDASFQQPLYPEHRIEELNKEKKFLQTIIKWEYVIMVIPVAFWAILPPLVAKKQSMESALPWDHTKSPTFELTASYHFIYGVFMTATWCANDSWMMIYMSLITVELRHLRFSMISIFSRLKTTKSGKIVVDDVEITDFEQEKMESRIYFTEISNVRRLLKLWIDYHSELISFSGRLQNFYSPIVLLQYIFIVGFSSMILFYIASGLLAPIFIVTVIAILTAHGFALFLMSWFGDRIATQNSLLSQEAFSQDWQLYPKDITKSLQFIMMQSKRPVELSAFSLMPLNIKSFDQILKACYSFFMFIKDSSQKTTDKRN